MNTLKQNIFLLKKIDYPFQLISDSHKLKEVDENYDGLYNLRSLEYAIYYTFQESFTKIDHTWNKLDKLDILNDLDIILDNLDSLKEIYINSDTGEEQPNVLHDDDVIQKLGDAQFNDLYYLIVGRYEFYKQKVNEMSLTNIITHNFDAFCNTLLNSKQYLYPPDLFLLNFGISNIRYGNFNQETSKSPGEDVPDDDVPDPKEEESTPVD